MNAQHTPGPWRVGRTKNGIRYIWEDNSILPLAHVSSLEDGKNNEAKAIEADANARLIAAAPDMLEALKLVANLSFHEIAASNARAILNDTRHQTVESTLIAKKNLEDAKMRIRKALLAVDAAIAKATEVQP